LKHDATGFAGESAPRHRCSGIIAEVRTTHGIRESYERSGRKVTYIGDEMYASDAPYSGYFFYNSIVRITVGGDCLREFLTDGITPPVKVFAT